MDEILRFGALVGGRWGQPGRLSHGDVVPRADMWPVFPGRPEASVKVVTSKPTGRAPTRRSLNQMVQRPPAGTIPDAPGSYQFKDRDGRVIYVGKAKSLRSRLNNHFQNPATLLPRPAQLVAAAETVEWIEVNNEVDALMLEYNLIQRHRPRFNIRL